MQSASLRAEGAPGEEVRLTPGSETSSASDPSLDEAAALEAEVKETLVTWVLPAALMVALFGCVTCVVLRSPQTYSRASADDEEESEDDRGRDEADGDSDDNVLEEERRGRACPSQGRNGSTSPASSSQARTLEESIRERMLSRSAAVLGSKHAWASRRTDHELHMGME